DRGTCGSRCASATASPSASSAGGTASGGAPPATSRGATGSTGDGGGHLAEALECIPGLAGEVEHDVDVVGGERRHALDDAVGDVAPRPLDDERPQDLVVDHGGHARLVTGLLRGPQPGGRIREPELLEDERV